MAQHTHSSGPPSPSPEGRSSSAAYIEGGRGWLRGYTSPRSPVPVATACMDEPIAACRRGLDVQPCRKERRGIHMNLHVPEEWEPFIRTQVQSGRDASENEVLDEALRLLQERDLKHAGEEARIEALLIA